MKVGTIWAASLLALGSSVTGPAASAGPALTCDADSCYGKDPVAYGCSRDAVTLGSPAGNASEWVELRYSATCRAAWAKIHGQPQTHGHVKNSQGRFAGVEISTGHDAFSVMVNDQAGVQAFACVFIGNRPFCTAAH